MKRTKNRPNQTKKIGPKSPGQPFGLEIEKKIVVDELMIFFRNKPNQKQMKPNR